MRKRVVVLSPTIQWFQGVRYYREGRSGTQYYKSTAGQRLHRVVWEEHEGPIPDGFHIHHRNNNRNNNQIWNLEGLSNFDHKSLHSKARGKPKPSRQPQVCPQCGATFERRSNAKACSDSCRTKWMRKQRALLVTRYCVLCDRPFHGDRRDTCSKKCRYLLAARSLRAR